MRCGAVRRSILRSSSVTPSDDIPREAKGQGRGPEAKRTGRTVAFVFTSFPNLDRRLLALPSPACTKTIYVKWIKEKRAKRTIKELSCKSFLVYVGSLIMCMH